MRPLRRAGRLLSVRFALTVGHEHFHANWQHDRRNILFEQPLLNRGDRRQRLTFQLQQSIQHAAMLNVHQQRKVAVLGNQHVLAGNGHATDSS